MTLYRDELHHRESRLRLDIMMSVLFAAAAWFVSSLSASAEAAMPRHESRRESTFAVPPMLLDRVVEATTTLSEYAQPTSTESSSDDATQDRADDETLRALVTDSEGRLVEGRLVRVYVINERSRFEFASAMTERDGIARFKGIKKSDIENASSDRRFTVALTECPAPAPMIDITSSDLGGEPVRLRLPPQARFEVRISKGMFLSHLSSLRAHLEEDSGAEEVEESREWWMEVKHFETSESTISGACAIAVGTPAIWSHVESRRRFRVEIRFEGRRVAERRGIEGPRDAGDAVAVEIGPTDLTDDWFGIEVVDENGVPVGTQIFDLESPGLETTSATVKTDGQGRGIIKRPRRHGPSGIAGTVAYPTRADGAATGTATWQIRQRLFQVRRATFVEPSGISDFVKVAFSDEREKVLLAGTIISSTGRPRGGRSFRAVADDWQPASKGPIVIVRCECGLEKGVDVRTDEEGRFEIRSRCRHRRIIVSAFAVAEYFEVAFDDLPQEIVRIQAKTWNLATADLVVDERFGSKRPTIESFVRERMPNGTVSERRSGMVSRLDDRWVWKGKMRAGVPTSVVVRLEGTKEVIATTAEYLPHGAAVDVAMEPIDVRGRIRYFDFDVRTASGERVDDIVLRLVDGDFPESFFLRREQRAEGRFTLATTSTSPRISVYEGDFVRREVDLVDGMTIELERRLRN